MAAVQVLRFGSQDDPAARACRQVALGSALILFAALAGLFVLTHPKLRQALGVNWLIGRLPLQHHVQHAVQVMKIYKRRPGLVAWAFLITFPVHITVTLSAMLAGKAFALPLPIIYYFVVVPVIVLAGAVPISPQGAGVMEFFAIQLTKQYGMTVSQAFALTMSIRVVQIFWNLTGGIFVLRGGYHAPTQREQEELEQDDSEETSSIPARLPGAPSGGPASQTPL